VTSRGSQVVNVNKLTVLPDSKECEIRLR